MAYAATIGLLIGRIALKEFGSQPWSEMLVGIGGGTLLLWGAIALRGWDIQTNDGETLVEKVNFWVVRQACLVGTVLTIVSISWSTV